MLWYSFQQNKKKKKKHIFLRFVLFQITKRGCDVDTHLLGTSQWEEHNQWLTRAILWHPRTTESNTENQQKNLLFWRKTKQKAQNEKTNEQKRRERIREYHNHCLVWWYGWHGNCEECDVSHSVNGPLAFFFFLYTPLYPTYTHTYTRKNTPFRELTVERKTVLYMKIKFFDHTTRYKVFREPVGE